MGVLGWIYLIGGPKKGLRMVVLGFNVYHFLLFFPTPVLVTMISFAAPWTSLCSCVLVPSSTQTSAFIPLFPHSRYDVVCLPPMRRDLIHHTAAVFRYNPELSVFLASPMIQDRALCSGKMLDPSGVISVLVSFSHSFFVRIGWMDGHSVLWLGCVSTLL
ncbi:hypothetical protein BJ165DRAFT_869506 [Panaeolus papilionaceus]|nr:hypothetical protein BJ165DRAFT_869506 [Panaeolus papilionaceus]